VFLNVGKWEYRKGHDVLLEAFNKAFEPTDNVRLVMNCHNPCCRAKSREEERYNRTGPGRTAVQDGPYRRQHHRRLATQIGRGPT
jgi:hypothetical protein